MNLLCVTASFPYGPSEAFLQAELQEILRTNHSVTIVPCVGRGPLNNYGLSFALLDRSLLSWTIFWGALIEIKHSPRRALRAFALLFRSRNLRVLATNSAVYPKALWLAHQMRQKHYDHLHAYWASAPSTMALVAAEMLDVPWSFTAHRWDILEDNLMHTKLKKTRFARFVSHEGKCAAGANQDNAVVLHLGVSLPDGVPAVSDTSMELTLLCPATFTFVKGHSYLFAALALLRKRDFFPRVILAGDGPLRSALISECERLGISDQVSFPGFLSHTDLLNLYRERKVTAVVLPSLHEGIPVSLMEAMASGIPVVGTVAGGTPELLRDGAGLLVPPADPQALADAIELIARHPDLRRRLSIAGRKRVEEEFDVRKAMAELVRQISQRSSTLVDDFLAAEAGSR